MALAIDASSPAAVNQTVATTAAATTASFTPPAGSLLLVLWIGNSSATVATTTPAAPVITDNLATHLTYTSVQLANPSTTGTTTVGGQAAIWTAPVGSSAAMTVTVTNQAASGALQSGLQIQVLTGANRVTPVDTSGIGDATTAATAFAQNYTPVLGGTGGNGFMAFVDWTATGTAAPTAGTGTTLIAGFYVSPNHLIYGFYRRTAFDDVAGTQNTLNAAMATADPALWAWADISPQSTDPGTSVMTRQAVKRASLW